MRSGIQALLASGEEFSMPPISTSETDAGPHSPQMAPQPASLTEPVGAAVRVSDDGPLPIYGFEWRRDGKHLLHYLLDSEVHTFAFSVAANAILSFIPFIVLLYTIAHGVFHSQ